MQRRHLLTTLLAGLGACATPSAAPPLLLRLAPTALGRRLALAQQLRIFAGGAEYQFEALLEADEEALLLALLAFGQPLVRLRWDGTALTQQAAPGWPAAVSAERILSDLVLVLWPAAAITAALPPEWTLQHDGTSRELRWRSATVQRVRYDTPRRTELEHCALG